MIRSLRIDSIGQHHTKIFIGLLELFTATDSAAITCSGSEHCVLEVCGGVR